MLGHVANGSIYRYNIGTREKTVLVANEPCGVTALVVDGSTMYYITSYPQYIMTLDLKSGQPKLVANLTVPNDPNWNPITHMRVSGNSLFWSLGTDGGACGCVETSTLQGEFVTGVLSGMLFHEGFAVDASSGTIYAAAGNFKQTVLVGGQGKPTSSFTIKGNGFEIIQDIEYDAVHDKLYYGGTIPLQVSDTSGGNLQTLLSSLDSGYVKYIRVDPVRGRLYWLTAARQYMTAGLNGEAPTTMFQLQDKSTSDPPFCFGFDIGPELA